MINQPCNSSDRWRTWFYYWVLNIGFKMEKMRWTHRHRMDANEIFLLSQKWNGVEKNRSTTTTQRNNNQNNDLIDDAMRSVHPMRIHWWEKVQKSGSVSFRVGRQWLGIYSIFRFEWLLLLFVVAVFMWRGRSSRRYQPNGFNANIQIRQCSPKKEAPFSHLAALHLEFMICFFQIVSISFRKRKSFMPKAIGLNGWNESNYFDLIWIFCHLIVRRSRSLYQLTSSRYGAPKRLAKCVIVQSIGWRTKRLLCSAFHLSFDLFANARNEHLDCHCGPCLVRL